MRATSAGRTTVALGVLPPRRRQGLRDAEDHWTSTLVRQHRGATSEYRGRIERHAREPLGGGDPRALRRAGNRVHIIARLASAMPAAEAFARARRHAQRALALDPDLADAHPLLAQVAPWVGWDAQDGERHARRALALEPHNAGALMTTAFCLNARSAGGGAGGGRRGPADPLGQVTLLVWL